jgi:hypothetical protein
MDLNIPKGVRATKVAKEMLDRMADMPPTDQERFYCLLSLRSYAARLKRNSDYALFDAIIQRDLAAMKNGATAEQGASHE